MTAAATNLRRLARRRLPAPARRWARYGGVGRTCPCCRGRWRRFAPSAPDGHLDVVCPRCASLPRQRMLCLYLQRSGALAPATTLLHYAPEPSTQSFLRRQLGGGYQSIDIASPLADAVMDATALDYLEESFDVLVCSHVLEHIPDDRRAMREMRRVLRPGGRALLQHPIVPGQRTFEDPTVTDPAERLRLFSQPDHVRVYGPDIEDRLREAGFSVEIVTPEDLCDAASRRRHGLGEPLSPRVRASDVYVCRR